LKTTDFGGVIRIDLDQSVTVFFINFFGEGHMFDDVMAFRGVGAKLVGAGDGVGGTGNPSRLVTHTLYRAANQVIPVRIQIQYVMVYEADPILYAIPHEAIVRFTEIAV
jgi:hypothetical protein